MRLNWFLTFTALALHATAFLPDPKKPFVPAHLPAVERVTFHVGDHELTTVFGGCRQLWTEVDGVRYPFGSELPVDVSHLTFLSGPCMDYVKFSWP